MTHISDDEPLLRKGRVDFGGICKTVSLAALPEASVGEYVLVHAGIAITRVDAGEAARVFEYLRDIGELEEVEEIPS